MEVPISGEGQLENLGKMGNNRESIVIQIGDGEFRKSISAPTPGTKILVMPQFSYTPDQILEENEKGQKFDFH